MNQLLSRRWALPPNFRSCTTRSPRPRTLTAEQALWSAVADSFESVCVCQVNARKPRRGVFGENQGDAEDSGAQNDCAAAARSAQDRDVIGLASLEEDVVRDPSRGAQDDGVFGEAPRAGRAVRPRPASASIRSASSSAGFRRCSARSDLGICQLSVVSCPLLGRL